LGYKYYPFQGVCLSDLMAVKKRATERIRSQVADG
jgi:hypothetical protein